MSTSLLPSPSLYARSPGLYPGLGDPEDCHVNPGRDKGRGEKFSGRDGPGRGTAAGCGFPGGREGSVRVWVCQDGEGRGGWC